MLAFVAHGCFFLNLASIHESNDAKGHTFGYWWLMKYCQKLVGLFMGQYG